MSQTESPQKPNRNDPKTQPVREAKERPVLSLSSNKTGVNLAHEFLHEMVLPKSWLQKARGTSLVAQAQNILATIQHRVNKAPLSVALFLHDRHVDHGGSLATFSLENRGRWVLVVVCDVHGRRSVCHSWTVTTFALLERRPLCHLPLWPEEREWLKRFFLELFCEILRGRGGNGWRTMARF